ncbi:Las1-like protein [Elsinoe fawcettii]|nr:Las1-like protein [Elsinoe fawcettii]
MVFHQRISQKTAEDHAIDADSFPVRATYTAALARFVTGFADLGRSRSGPGQSMLEVAKDIDLPAEFVELRHEATHEGMPNLSRLTKASMEALLWLRRTYWDRIEATGAFDPGPEVAIALVTGHTDSKEEAILQMRDLLKSYRRARKADIQGGKSMSQEATDACSFRLIDLASHVENGYTTLADSLCMHGTLIPSTTISALEQMNAAFQLWDKLLQGLSSQSRLFAKPLLRVMVNKIADAQEHNKHRGLEFWLIHIFEDHVWKVTLGSRHATLLRHTIEQCFLNPAEMTSRIARELVISINTETIQADTLKIMCEAVFEDYHQAADTTNASRKLQHTKHPLRNTTVR